MADRVEFNLNEQNIIVSVGGEWDQFALANNAPELVGEQVIGLSVLDFVSGNVTRQFLQSLLQLVRSGSRPIELEYRCDSPLEKRFMKMHVSLTLSGQVRFINSTLRIEHRDQACHISKSVQRGKNTNIRCSICNLIKSSHDWLEPEKISAFNTQAHTGLQVVYGICDSCAQQLQKQYLTQ
ncbi:MAG: hypothetical protein HQL49_00415 [Gammaproteobacteria bacterium]|nr:hypothetical protein [Gammaproteobacteria bacterium]